MRSDDDWPQSSIRFLMLIMMWSLLPTWQQPSLGQGKIDFDREVKPIFAQYCVKCHGQDKQRGGLRLDSAKALIGGDTGKVILPQGSKKSLLIQMLNGNVPDDPDAIMPPKGPRLSEKEIALVAKWIDQGAVWPDGSVITIAKGNMHWSLQALKRPAVPSASESVAEQWARNSIDNFILEKLKHAGLTPTAEASRRVLIRRLNFDLIGLPPTPEEVALFINDKQPKAYERLVDRLLASPHYGERWARHWLDVVRFGESHGFEYNQPRSNAWHYRNWVIDALNNDMPYDRFVRMQLAGDLLAKDDSSMVAATGFLVAGPHNTTLPSSQKMRMTMQQDEYEDLVGTIGQTFLGLTVNCARCHSHKFDPISQREYYSFVAAVAGVNHGDRTVTDTAKDGANVKAMKAFELERRKIKNALGRVEKVGRERVLTARNKSNSDGKIKKPDAPKPVARWDFNDDLEDSIGQAHGEAIGGAKLDGGTLVVGEKGAYVRTKPLAFDLREKTLEVWVKLNRLKQSGGGVITVQTTSGGVFDSVVYAEREPARWMAGSNSFVRYDSFKAAPEKEADKQFVHIAIVYRADGTIIGYRNGKPYGRAYRKGLQAYAAGKTQVLFGLRHEPKGGNRHLSAKIDRAQLHSRALAPNEVAASAGIESDYVSEEQLLAVLSHDEKNSRAGLKKQMADLETKIKTLQATIKPFKVYAVTPRNPGAIRLLRRGNVADPGDVVEPGGLSAVPGVNSDFGLNANASDADRRTKLAQWIANQDNPLFARVIVNRLWHYHFGNGIVNTPSDFGVNGGKPSHRQLLDWLAAELVDRKFSLKQMHRLIVTSATYRQGVAANLAASKVDANNRLLWRRTPRRLEAEALRDAMLAVSGQLNRSVGGIGFRDVREYKYKGSFFYDPIEQSSPESFRRTIYRFSPRGAKKTMLDTFDCPDPSAMAPKRAVTTTPLQALTLMNNPFVLQTADHYAKHAQSKANDIEGQVKHAYFSAYGRAVGETELAEAKQFVEEHGLAAFCRVVFNSNEFLYVQ